MARTNWNRPQGEVPQSHDRSRASRVRPGPTPKRSSPLRSVSASGRRARRPGCPSATSRRKWAPARRPSPASTPAASEQPHHPPPCRRRLRPRAQGGVGTDGLTSLERGEGRGVSRCWASGRLRWPSSTGRCRPCSDCAHTPRCWAASRSWQHSLPSSQWRSPRSRRDRRRAVGCPAGEPGTEQLRDCEAPPVPPGGVGNEAQKQRAGMGTPASG